MSKILSLILTMLLLQMVCFVPLTVARPQTDKDTLRVAKIKENVARRGTGKRERVKVTLLDGRKISGYISEVRENAFVVIDQQTNASTTLAYTDVSQVKGRGLSVLAKVGIVAAVAGTVGILAAIVANQEGGTILRPLPGQ